MNKILIVGGVAGGASAAARLRRLDEFAEIIMFEKGEYISFANCGLPYYIGGDIKEKSSLTLQTPESFRSRFNVDVRVNNQVMSIDKDAKQIKVLNVKTGEEYLESYDKLILSPGAEPVRPNLPGINEPGVFTLRNIPDTYKIKDYITKEAVKSAVVVGGGYIGMEMAENLQHAGLKVTVVEAANHVIAPLDFDMACDVHNHIRQKGVNLILNEAVKSIRSVNNQLAVVLENQEILSDVVIMSVGVRPESKLAKDAGLNINPKGSIIVDEFMHTSDDNIYAVGDAIEVTDYVVGDKTYIPLAGPANKQGRIAADNICGLNRSYRGTQGTGILKCFDLTVGTTGINETRAKMAGLNYEKSYTYSASHASYYPGAVNMSIKIIFNKEDGRLLGAQVVGYEGTDKRTDVLATAIRANMTIYDLAELELSYAPPFSSAKDPVNMAGFTAENILTGQTKIFHWDQVDSLPRDGSVTLIDIRTPIEYQNGTIEGFINIPVDNLRENLHKLDKSKPVYVVCQIGLRGHVACRILSQHGYECYNLSGGYRLYNTINRKTAIKETINVDTQRFVSAASVPQKTIEVDACGLQCPGPIMKLSKAMNEAQTDDVILIKSTDPAFNGDVEAWCKRTGNTLCSVKSEKGISEILVKKGGEQVDSFEGSNGKNIIVFSGDLDKAIASFIIANAAASMGRKVSMFFTFWGLNILRRPEKVSVKKNLISKMFGFMMPRGSKKLKLSKMNMAGIGAKMIRGIMKNKNIDSLESLIQASMENGVELVACTMSMDVMGIKMEELIDGVKLGGAAAMIAHAEESDMSLFI
jgi:NADPH-dependent 2,4-dienoyl-CoA reductase/sulfur reductase-like enzyme/peroxiredoxin family protein/rhodanese-related sulfurtransferase/TusA-related sulfurtransferase